MQDKDLGWAVYTVPVMQVCFYMLQLWILVFIVLLGTFSSIQ